MNDSQKNPSKVVVYGNAEKCKACHKCEVACIASHNKMTPKEAMKVRKNFEPRIHVIKTDAVKMPIQCRQCDDAPCVAVCPTNALIQGDDGIITMRNDLCAGCSMCVVACPYGAISLAKAHQDGDSTEDGAEATASYSLESAPYGARTGSEHLVSYRCDLCAEYRKTEGKEVYACVAACPFKALAVVDADKLHELMRDNHGEDITHLIFPESEKL